MFFSHTRDTIAIKNKPVWALIFYLFLERLIMKSLVLYSTIVGGFYAHNENLEKAINIARSNVGDDVWKKGFSGKDTAGATMAALTEFKEAGIDPVHVEGELKKVSFVENKDNAGNTYPKLRVDIQNGDEDMVLSLDLKSDVAQRLIVKLDNCQPGDHVKLAAWASPVEKGDRTFINHAASIKNGAGEEVKANPNFSSGLKQQTEALENTLKSAGINDNKVINAAKTNKRIEAHKEKLLDIQTRFN